MTQNNNLIITYTENEMVEAEIRFYEEIEKRRKESYIIEIKSIDYYNKIATFKDGSSITFMRCENENKTN